MPSFPVVPCKMRQTLFLALPCVRKGSLLLAALAVFVLMALSSAVPRALAAAPLVWLQIESQPSREEAISSAKAYAEALEDVGPVHVFAAGTRWHSLALGPMDEDRAWALRRELRRARLIPPDAFVTEGKGLQRHVWPAGQFDGMSGTEIARLSPEGPPAPQSSASASAPTGAGSDRTASAAAPLNGNTSDASTAIEQADAIAAVEADTETLAEARARERRLDRETKRAIQEALKWAGHYAGKIDGAFGRGTRSAVARWQEGKGYAPTGFLTGRQMKELLGEYERFMARAGIKRWTDEKAGLALDLPLGLVRFDRYEPPFAHFEPREKSGVRVVLVSRPGKPAALKGLRDFFKDVALVPANVEAKLKNGTLVMEGADEARHTRVYLRHFNGTIKGYLVSWPRELDNLMARIEPRMAKSLTSLGRTTLDPDLVTELDSQTAPIVAGLEIRRPAMSGSGIFAGPRGEVLTLPALVENCTKVTINHDAEARVELPEGNMGPARLVPKTPLSPPAVAVFAGRTPRAGERVLIAGFSHGGALGMPSVSDGRIVLPVASTNPPLMTVQAPLLPGDRGGPVVDAEGRVLGMVHGPELAGRHLPDGMNFVLALAPGFRSNFVTTASMSANTSSAPSLSRHAREDLARGMTALVSCWR